MAADFTSQRGKSGTPRAEGATSDEAAIRSIMQLAEAARPVIEQLVASAKQFQIESRDAEAADNVRKIVKTARDLLDVISRQAAVDRPAEGTNVDGANSCDVIYIEDDPVNFTLVKRILAKRPSVNLAHAARGGVGLSLAQSHKPKLILLDLNLPDMHGSEVLRQLQRNDETAGIPVVVISADATASQIERLLSAGARNYLTKPFTIPTFLAVVDEVLEEAVGGK